MSQLLTAYEADGTETGYFYGAEGLAGQYNTGTKQYLGYHYDNIGSTTMVTDIAGKIVEQFAYGTYGELLTAVKNKIRFLYNGSYGVTTDENGLYYMRARYYNPDIKRFINQDIKVGDIGSSQSLNRYAYCEGNPVSLVDPFGLSPNGTNSGNSIWDVFTVYDILGLFGFAGNFMGPPGVVLSIVCDVADAVLYFREGEPVKGALSLVCAIPGIGDVIGAVRNGTRLAGAAKVVGTTIRAAQKLYVTAESAKTALDLAGDAKMEYAVNGGNLTLSVIAKKTGAITMAGIAVISGRSLMKDVGSFAKTTEIRINTRAKETAGEVSGKNFQYEGVAACFTAGTQIKTAEGDKNIEDVEEGDYVLAEDPETGEQEYKQVVQTYIHEKTTLVHVFIEDEEIITTEEHPFYVEGTGFVCAGELETGDIIRTADGRKLPVDGIEAEYLEEPVLVYNFEVEDYHTYYVSGLGVLVHNTCIVETSYGKSIVISEQKMYQLGNHYNKHGRNMGFSSKKEYEQAARDFFEQYGDVAEIYEGTFNNAHGDNVGMRQIILRHGDKQLIISKESGQLIDFYEGTSLSSFIDVERVQ